MKILSSFSNEEMVPAVLHLIKFYLFTGLSLNVWFIGVHPNIVKCEILRKVTLQVWFAIYCNKLHLEPQREENTHF